MPRPPQVRVGSGVAWQRVGAGRRVRCVLFECGVPGKMQELDRACQSPGLIPNPAVPSCNLLLPGSLTAVCCRA